MNNKEEDRIPLWVRFSLLGTRKKLFGYGCAVGYSVLAGICLAFSWESSKYLSYILLIIAAVLCVYVVTFVNEAISWMDRNSKWK